MSADLEKVHFALDASDWHGHASESLWAEPVAGVTPGTAYRLKNSPFYARGVSFLDIVCVARSADGGLDFSAVIDHSGHSTYMLLVPPNSSAFEERWQQLQALGCTYESGPQDTGFGKRILYSVDVPSTTDIYAVYSILEMGQKENTWLFQEGHVGHKLRDDAS